VQNRIIGTADAVLRKAPLKMKTLKKCFVILAALAMLFGPGLLDAQALNSTVQSVTLTASISESITLSVSPAAITFTASGTSSTPVAGSAPIVVSSLWYLAPTRTSYKVYQYFATTTALTGTGNNVGVGAVTSTVDGGSTTAFNQSCLTFTSCGPLVNNTTITGSNWDNHNVAVTNSDVIAINFNGAAPGNFTGTLNFMAQAL
jgi:hypothetical protein